MSELRDFPARYRIGGDHRYSGEFERLIERSVIDKRRLEQAVSIVEILRREGCSTPPVVLAIGHGAIKYGPDIATDIARVGLEEGIDPEFDTLHISGGGTTGSQRLRKVPSVDLKGRHVVIAEDIAETGNTLKLVTRLVEHQNPASLLVACLLMRPSAARVLNAMPELRKPDFYPQFRTDASPTAITHPGFILHGGFAAGYGMDVPPDGEMRMWPHIYARLEGKPNSYEVAQISTV